jgi:hypothetical protein
MFGQSEKARTPSTIAKPPGTKQSNAIGPTSPTRSMIRHKNQIGKKVSASAKIASKTSVGALYMPRISAPAVALPQCAPSTARACDPPS